MTDGGLPGEDLIETGILDLYRGLSSIEALLVSIGAPCLRRIGIEVPPTISLPEIALYERLAESGSDSAHSRYNALIRRLVSFERAAECGPVDDKRVRVFLASAASNREQNRT